MADSQLTRAQSTSPDDSTVEYRAIPGHPQYEAGTNGTIRSLVYSNKPRLLKASKRNGYPSVSLGRGLVATVHRLVLETFVGPCPAGMEACHNNGNRNDSRLSNLRWDTRKNNHADKRTHGTHQSGDKNPAAILSAEAVIAVKRRIVAGETCKAIAVDLGVDPSTIGKIRNGEHWIDVAPELNAQFPQWMLPTVNGRSVRQEAIRLGLNPRNVAKRLRKGYSIEEAFSTKSAKGYRRAPARGLLTTGRPSGGGG